MTDEMKATPGKPGAMSDHAGKPQQHPHGFYGEYRPSPQGSRWRHCGAVL